ncbi:hypothetical protein PY650_31640 [Rhizobium calliandrae]|uniref:DUF6841 domain-containing protein n=1 Tax=Rhizobium calliandrae TaxID=1312182 RepID=A0ABT7KN78_9HYPH|nr:hypothetical protein [Rhizobium calliandrae]MDL2410091.1 hypothetical protein [Rhizobium calliandrae]
MNQAAKRTSSIAAEPKVVSAIRELFKSYGPTFVDLANGKRSDVSALLNFYGAPLRFIGSDFHMVMKDDDEITGKDGIGGELARLHKVHFAESELDKCDINVLNPRAALVNATWLRRDSAGALMERFQVVYLVAQTQDGWRITSAINATA